MHVGKLFNLFFGDWVRCHIPNDQTTMSKQNMINQQRANTIFKYWTTFQFNEGVRESSDGHIGCQIEMKWGNIFGKYIHGSFSSNGGVIFWWEVWKVNSLHYLYTGQSETRMTMSFCQIIHNEVYLYRTIINVKFGSNWKRSFSGKYWNVKSEQTVDEQMTDARWWQKLTQPFG